MGKFTSKVIETETYVGISESLLARNLIAYFPNDGLCLAEDIDVFEFVPKTGILEEDRIRVMISIQKEQIRVRICKDAI